MVRYAYFSESGRLTGSAFYIHFQSGDDSHIFIRFHFFSLFNLYNVIVCFSESILIHTGYLYTYRYVYYFITIIAIVLLAPFTQRRVWNDFRPCRSRRAVPVHIDIRYRVSDGSGPARYTEIQNIIHHVLTSRQLRHPRIILFGWPPHMLAPNALRHIQSFHVTLAVRTFPAYKPAGGEITPHMNR